MLPTYHTPLENPSQNSYTDCNGPVSDPRHPLCMNEGNWKEKLTPEQYSILREKGTEPAFSGRYLNEKSKGIYRCMACGQELFSSDTKFDSGTGWPSFDKAIPGSVEYKKDNNHLPAQAGGAERTEVVCSNCGSHLGHVFEDLPRHAGNGKAGGPRNLPDGRQATGKRYCINSVCLDLKKKGK